LGAAFFAAAFLAGAFFAAAFLAGAFFAAAFFAGAFFDAGLRAAVGRDAVFLAPAFFVAGLRAEAAFLEAALRAERLVDDAEVFLVAMRRRRVYQPPRRIPARMR